MLDYALSRTTIGGLRLKPHKRRTTQQAIEPAFIPRLLVIPSGAPSEDCKALVAPGERVLRGQTLVTHEPETGIPDSHASTSGIVRSMGSRAITVGASFRTQHCVVLETDGADEAIRRERTGHWPEGSAARLERIRTAGIVGLGGAAFPTARKLESLKQCKAVIVNGAECEPYISCDDMLMRRSAAEIIAGGLIISDLVGAEECIIAIESDKPAAIETMRAAAVDSDDTRLRIAQVPSIYPAGGERQLIELLTGIEVPRGRYPSEIGYVCQNVATAYSVFRLAQESEPLLSRVVTVAGDGVAAPRNIEVLIGTPIEELIQHCGGYTSDAARLIVGGSMMGLSLPDDSVPVTKSTNCIVVASRSELDDQGSERPCIRCGDCAAVCPVRLLPQELLRAAQMDKPDELSALGLEDCIECGCCDIVCPSHIRLTSRFRTAKDAYRLYERHRALADDAERRHRARESRLGSAADRERSGQSGLLEELGHSADERARTIAAAVGRARRKRNRSGGPQ